MTGASHSSVKRYRELARNSPTNGLERELLLDGPHLLFEAHKSRLTIESAAFDEDILNDPETKKLAEQLLADGADVFIVSRKTLESMSPVRTPAGVIGEAGRTFPSLTGALFHERAGRRRAYVQDRERRRHHAHGRGGRSDRVRRDGIDSGPAGWKALRGSMGSALRLPIARGEIADVLRALRAAGIETSALVPRAGRPLFEVDFKQPSALILGSEGAGLPDEVLRQVDRRITIPMQQPVESLNVGVAAALVLYEAFRQRNNDPNGRARL